VGRIVTVSCDSKGYHVTTECSDCAVLIEKNNSQAELIDQLDKTISQWTAYAKKLVKRTEEAGK
jgi:hypothetical protein